jgi:uncharacterized membrane protein
MAIRARLRRFVTSRFGAIFAGGAAMAIFWLVMLPVLGLGHGETGRSLLNVTLAHLAGGRASGIAIGKNAGLSVLTLIFAATYIDTTIVLVGFPLVVSGYKLFASFGFFGSLAKEAVRSAEQSKPQVAKYGIVGLFLFVVFPFYMTGPLVGSIIGYFLGWPVSLTLAIVIPATIVAIVAWAFAFDQVYNYFEGLGGVFGKVIPVVVVTAIIVAAVVTRLRSYAKSRAASGVAPRPPQAAGGAAPADSGPERKVGKNEEGSPSG